MIGDVVKVGYKVVVGKWVIDYFYDVVIVVLMGKMVRGIRF